MAAREGRPRLFAGVWSSDALGVSASASRSAALRLRPLFAARLGVGFEGISSSEELKGEDDSRPAERLAAASSWSSISSFPSSSSSRVTMDPCSTPAPCSLASSPLRGPHQHRMRLVEKYRVQAYPGMSLATKTNISSSSCSMNGILGLFVYSCLFIRRRSKKMVVDCDASAQLNSLGGGTTASNSDR